MDSQTAQVVIIGMLMLSFVVIELIDRKFPKSK